MSKTAISHSEAKNILKAMPDPDSVRRFERLGLQLPQTKLETVHVVHGGVCARTILIPAGTVLTGAELDVDTVCVIVGDITVTTDDGVKRFSGHNILPAIKGNKRIGITHEDTYWTMVFKTDCDSIEEIEEQMTREHNRLQTRKMAQTFEKNDLVKESQFDFDRFAVEYRLPPHVLDAVMSYTDDLTVTEQCLDKVDIGESLIHGRGLFAKDLIHAGDFICPARVDNKRAIGGRFINHSNHPNAEFRLSDSGIDVYALRDINSDEEVLLDYRQAFEVNPTLENLQCQE